MPIKQVPSPYVGGPSQEALSVAHRYVKPYCAVIVERARDGNWYAWGAWTGARKPMTPGRKEIAEAMAKHWPSKSFALVNRKGIWFAKG